MITQIIPAVSPLPPAKASLPERDGAEGNFKTTLDETKQRADGDRTKTSPADDGDELSPEDDCKKKRVESDEPAVQSLIALPLPTANMPSSSADVPPSGSVLDRGAPQQQLQQLVAYAGSAQTSPAMANPLPVAPSSMQQVNPAESAEIPTGSTETGVVTEQPEMRPVRSGQKSPSASVHHGALKAALDAHGPEHGQKDAGLKLADAPAKESFSLKPGTQVLTDSPRIPAQDTRFMILPESGLRLSEPTIAERPAAMTQAMSPLPMTTLAEPLGTPAWQQALSHQLSWFTRSGVHNAELRLHPEELGAIQVNLRLNNDRAQMHFITDNHQVRAALEAALPHLRTSLAESGIELGHGSVGSEAHPSWKENSQSSHSHAGERSGSEGTVEGAVAGEDAQPLIIHQRIYPNEINTFI